MNSLAGRKLKKFIASTSAMNNFRKIADMKTGGLLQEAEASKLWDKNTLRTTHAGTAHADISDIWIRYPAMEKHAGNIADVIDDLECVDYPAMDEIAGLRNVIQDIMFLTNGHQLGRVLLTSLKPDGRILPHDDAGKAAQYYDRYHLCLKSEPGNTFRAGDEIVSMKPGELWWFDNLVEHELQNKSSAARIHLILDIKGSQ